MLQSCKYVMKLKIWLPDEKKRFWNCIPQELWRIQHGYLELHNKIIHFTSASKRSMTDSLMLFQQQTALLILTTNPVVEYLLVKHPAQFELENSIMLRFWLWFLEIELRFSVAERHRKVQWTILLCRVGSKWRLRTRAEIEKQILVLVQTAR